MTTLELISALRQFHVIPKAEGNALRLTGNTKDLPPELLQQVKDNKAALLDFLNESRHQTLLSPIPLVARHTHYPLSNAQKRIWVLSQFDGGTQAYNITTGFYLQGTVNIPYLQQAFQWSIDRHDSLRTVFREADNVPVQVVQEQLSFEIETGVLLPENKKQQLVAELNTMSHYAFDLENGPLLKVRILTISESEFALIFAIHHIISDGWSVGVLVQEVMDNYRRLCTGDPLPVAALKIQYKDYSAWLHAKLEGEEGQALSRFWKDKELQTVDPIRLPNDYSRPDFNSFKGASLLHQFDPFFYENISLLARNCQTTVFNVFRAVLSLCLHRISNQSTLIIGTPVAGRTHADLYNQVGLFVNTLPLMSAYKGQLTFREYLTQISSDSLAASEHQDYPFDSIIEDAAIVRDPARNPLFDVMMVVQNTALGDGTIDIRRQHGFTLNLLDKYLYGEGNLLKTEVPVKFDLNFNFGAADNRHFMEIEYRTQLFTEATIRVIHEGFLYLLQQVIADNGILLDQLEIANPATRNRILYTFNQPINTFEEQSLPELFLPALETYSSATALITGDNKYTYRELLTSAYAVADALKKAAPGMVGMLLDRTQCWPAAVLGTLLAHQAYVPVDLNYPAARIEYLLENAGVTVLLTDAKGLQNVPLNFGGTIIMVDELTPLKDFSFELRPQQNELAYLIYTSGSTGTPKGVEITHGNVIAFLKWALAEFEHTPYDIMYAVTSYTFDLSVFELLLPLLQGKQIRILTSALEIETYLQQDKQVFLNTVPSVIRHLVEQGVSLENVIAINMAGEALPRKLKTQLDYKRMEVRNLYGPSEDTTYSTIYRFVDDGREVIPIGRSVGYSQAYILNDQLQLLPEGIEGEICLSGASIARGYLHQPNLTEAKFVANPFVPGERLYKTGDIGKWLPDGQLLFIGRRDGQVKLRGYRIELEEIQFQLEKTPGIAQAVVTIVTVGGEPAIAAYWKGAADTVIEAELKKHLPAYMLPSYYIRLTDIPVNSNGKVDLKALPSPASTVREAIIHPVNTLQEQVLHLWEEILSRKGFGIMQNFFGLGGNSLQATRLRARLAGLTGKNITLNQVFQYPTVAQQAALLQEAAQANETIQTVSPAQSYPLSYAQERLWILNRFAEASVAYHMPAAFRVRGEIDLHKLEQAFRRIIGRHEILRTVFREENGQPVQVVLPANDFPFKIKKAITTDLHAFLQNEWQQPFDLENGPLLRVSLITSGEGEILSFNMHHIISDGWSIGVLYKELKQVALQPLPIQYKDYAVWQRNYLSGNVLDFWKDQTRIQPLELPYDFPRPAIKTYNGSTITYDFSAAIAKGLESTASHYQVSLFTGIMTSVNILLKKLSNQDDITIGTPVHGRDNLQLHDLVGFFVNTLPLRSTIRGTDSYESLLQQQRDVLLNAFDYQHFSFERLIEILQPVRDMSRSPLFDVMVVLQETVIASENDDFFLGGRIPVPPAATKYDLTFSFAVTPGGLQLELEYNTDLFKQETVQRFIRYLEKIFTITTQQPAIQIRDILLLSAEEQTLLLSKADQTHIGYDQQATIISLFRQAARMYPDNIAVKSGDIMLTYAELDKASGQLALKLHEECKLAPEDRVILYTGRSHWMIISILAVLKAGGAYVPVDPAYPAARIDYIVNDSGSKVLLYDVENSLQLEHRLDLNTVSLTGAPFEATIHSGQLAYVIYTSGTTGNPKGVLIEHRNVTRLLFPDQQLFNFNENDRWSLFHSYCFDFSVWEMYGALLNGGMLVIVPKLIAQDSYAFFDFLSEEKITVLNQTPTAFRSLSLINRDRFFDTDLALRYLIFGGEALMPAVLADWHAAFPACRLINMYGITETTVHVTYKEITSAEILSNKSNIGIPIPTLSCYVLDNDLQQTPFGVIGELCVGGAGVARGYHNREALTSEKFIQQGDRRLYRSGDYARILANGDLEYIGRKDNQVKVRGHRIETGEIEAAIKRQSAVKDAAVLVQKNGQEEYELVAYVIPESETLTTTVVNTSLANELPAYMIPSFIVLIDHFPLTSNGKLDVAALPAPAATIGSSNYEEARNEIDEQILAIWKDVLGVETIGIDDDFFQLGGHSLKATRVVSKVQEIYNVRIDLKNLFQSPTVRHLSDYVAAVRWMDDSQVEIETSAGDEIIL